MAAFNSRVLFVQLHVDLFSRNKPGNEAEIARQKKKYMYKKMTKRSVKPGDTVRLEKGPWAGEQITLEDKEDKVLGVEGKEGLTYEANNKTTGEPCAFKAFKSTKKTRPLKVEYDWATRAGDIGAGPKVYGYSTAKRGIAMELLVKTIVQLLQEQSGTLTKEQQLDIISLAVKLDDAGIYHNDPNPLNLMTNKEGKFRWIDYGLTIKIDPKQHGLYPNVQAIWDVFHGFHGLESRRRIKKGSYDSYGLLKAAVDYVGGPYANANVKKDWDDWLKEQRKPGMLSQIRSLFFGDTSSGKDMAAEESSNDENEVDTVSTEDLPSEDDVCIFHTLLEAAKLTAKQAKIRHLTDVGDQLEVLVAQKMGFVLKQINTVDAIQCARSYVKVGTIILDNEPERLTSVRYGLQILDNSAKVESIRRQLDLLVRGDA